MRICPGTRSHLEGKHSELISAVNAIFNVRERGINWILFFVIVITGAL
jgi:hypothetical protein